MRRNSEPISNLSPGGSPQYASRNSYLQKRRSAHRSSTSRRSEILSILDATIGCLDDPEDDVSKSSLPTQSNDSADTSDLRASSQLPVNNEKDEVTNVHARILHKYSNDRNTIAPIDNAPEEPLWYENESICSEEETNSCIDKRLSSEAEEDTSTTASEEDDHEEYIVDEVDETIAFNKQDVVFEMEEEMSYASFPDDDDDGIVHEIVEEDVKEDEEDVFFCFDEEEILYESEDDETVGFMEAIVEEESCSDFEEESINHETYQEEIDCFEVEETNKSMVDEIIFELVVGDDGVIDSMDDLEETETAYQSLEEAGNDFQTEIPEDEYCGEEKEDVANDGFLAFTDDMVSVDYSIEEIILVDIESSSQVWATYAHEALEHETPESSVVKFQEEEQIESPQYCSHSSQVWTSAHETVGDECYGSSKEELGEEEESLVEPSEHDVSFSSEVWQTTHEASENEVSEVSMEGFGEEPAPSDVCIAALETMERDSVMSARGCKSVELDGEYFHDDSMMVDYKEDSRFHFPVPQIPVLQQWGREKHKAQLKVISQQVEEIGFCKEIEGPEVAPRTPRNILMAVLSQGDLYFKLRKVPSEHKKEYKSIAQMASSLGRLTRLQEHIVESVSSFDDTSVVEEWTPRKSPLSVKRSSGQRLSVEAAALGKTMRLREEYFTSWDEDEQREAVCSTNFGKTTDMFQSRTSNIDDARDHRGLLMHRSSLLIHRHVRDSRIAKMNKDWAMEDFLEEEEDRDFCLPTARSSPPNKFRVSKPEKRLSREEIAECLAQGVAEKWWERRYRLERPGAELRVHTSCNCINCKKPSPSSPVQTGSCYASQATSQIRNSEGEERTPPSPLEAVSKPKVALDPSCVFSGLDFD